MYFALFIVLVIVFFILYKTFFINNEGFSDKKSIVGIVDKIGSNFISTGGVKYFYLYILGSIISIFLMLYFSNNFILIFSLIVSLIALPFFISKYVKNKRILLFEKQLPDAIDLMAGSLVAGNSLSGAFSLIAQEYPPPLSNEIGLVVREQKLGVSIDQSLQNFTKRMPYNSVILTVSVIRTAAETGGELSDALKNVATTLRSIAQAEGKIIALTSQGKMQAWVVGSMPVFLIVVLSKMEPESMSKLWTSTEGFIALGAIIVFEVLGMIFIRKIVNIDI